MLIVALLILGIGFLQNIMLLLLDVLDLFNKFGSFVFILPRMGGLFVC
jgi:hypothetical protein